MKKSFLKKECIFQITKASCFSHVHFQFAKKRKGTLGITAAPFNEHYSLHVQQQPKDSRPQREVDLYVASTGAVGLPEVSQTEYTVN
jgi:hypothetical protein